MNQFFTPASNTQYRPPTQVPDGMMLVSNVQFHSLVAQLEEVKQGMSSVGSNVLALEAENVQLKKRLDELDQWKSEAGPVRRLKKGAKDRNTKVEVRPHTCSFQSRSLSTDDCLR